MYVFLHSSQCMCSRGRVILPTITRRPTALQRTHAHRHYLCFLWGGGGMKSQSGTDDGNRRQTSSLHRRGTASGVDIQLGAPTPLAVAVSATATARGGVVTAQPTQGAPWISSTAAAMVNTAPRRRSVFAPGGNRLVYKRAFSAR